MVDSGYFRLDCLPQRSALGYTDGPNGTWKSNIYSLPFIGGGDGGTFVTAEDMLRFWTALFDHRLLSAEGTADLLTPHVKVNEEVSYGYGVWIGTQEAGETSGVRRFSVVGEDPGVSFSSAVYPKAGIRTVVLARTTW